MKGVLLAAILVVLTVQFENQKYYCSLVPKGLDVCEKFKFQVCAITTSGKLIDYEDQCQACSNSQVVSYTLGGCGVLLSCSNNDREECGKDDKKIIPSCGFQQGKPMIDLEEHKCCKGTNYTKVIKGKCPKVDDCPKLPPQQKCEAKRPAPVDCPRDRTKPVCGVRADGTRRPSWNGCMACVETSIISFSEEPCASLPRHCISPGYRMLRKGDK